MRAALLSTPLFFISMAAGAQEPLPLPSLDPLNVDVSTSPAEWRRAPETRYVLITGCGGGAGGTSSSDFNNFGKGGNASEVITVIYEVDQDIYEIEIGPGGAPNLPGGDTRFYPKGQDPTTGLTFHGATPIPPSQSAVSPPNGLSSVFGSGGMGAGPSLNEPATAPANGVWCAGGGGGSNVESTGGLPLGPAVGAKGVDGHLLLYPLPDMQRLADFIALIDSLQPDPTDQPQQPTPADNP